MRPRQPVATMNADRTMKPMLRRTFVAGLVATCVLALAASAGGAPPRAVSVTLGAPVRHLAADAGGAAVHTQAGAGCDTILLWLPPAPPAKVAALNCQQSSTGSSVTSLALYGRRPAWVGYAGGNYREFTVATTLRGRATFVSLFPVPSTIGGGALASRSRRRAARVRAGRLGLAHRAGRRPDVPVPVLREGVRQGARDGDASRRRRRTAPPPRRRQGSHSSGRTAASCGRIPMRPRPRPTARSSSSSRSGKLTSGTRRFTVPRSSHLVGTRRGLAAVTTGRDDDRHAPSRRPQTLADRVRRRALRRRALHGDRQAPDLHARRRARPLSMRHGWRCELPWRYRESRTTRPAPLPLPPEEGARPRCDPAAAARSPASTCL